ncbi:MAG: type III-B CRISPR module RAMP protein Cmr1 [Aggregatilineales bacterium]
MARLNFVLSTASPWFVYGADPRGQPELRAASIRGQLRYWLRALIGARTTDLSEVWKQETAVFGSTGSASPISVRILPLELEENAVYKVPMLPHRQGSAGDRSPTPAVGNDYRISLSFITRPGVGFPQDFMPALSLWLLLGGVGKRSRRMFGAPRVVGFSCDPEDLVIEKWWAKRPKDPNRVSLVVKDTLDRYLSHSVLADTKDIPLFPTLHPKHSWIVVGAQAYKSHAEANQALFALLRGKYREYSNKCYFGCVDRNKRRASPLIAQVRQLEGGYYPVLTFMRSKPIPENVNWKIVNNFMNDAIEEFKGETVWGGAFQ